MERRVEFYETVFVPAGSGTDDTVLSGHIFKSLNSGTNGLQRWKISGCHGQRSSRAGRVPQKQEWVGLRRNSRSAQQHRAPRADASSRCATQYFNCNTHQHAQPNNRAVVPLKCRTPMPLSRWRVSKPPQDGEGAKLRKMARARKTPGAPL